MLDLVYDVDAPDIPAYGVTHRKAAARGKRTVSLCCFNDGVSCKQHVCERCGFNPYSKRGR